MVCLELNLKITTQIQSVSSHHMCGLCIIVECEFLNGCSVHQHSLHIDDLEDGGLIWGFLRSSVDSDDFAAWFAEVHLLGLLDHKLDKVVSSLVGWDLVSSHATSNVKLSDNREGDRASEDWDVWSVLGNEACHVSSVSEHNDEINVKVKGCRHGRGSQSFSSANWSWSEHLDVIKGSLIVNASLSFCSAFAHDGDCVDWVISTGCLTGKHDAISSIKDSIGDIRCFCTSWARSTNHGLKHLRCSHNWLSSNVSFLNHPLLCNEDFLWRDLHTKITSGNHDTIS